MKRTNAVGLALAMALMTTAANAAAQGSRDSDVQAPRGNEEVQAPRGQAEVQAPRGEDAQAPRH